MNAIPIEQVLAEEAEKIHGPSGAGQDPSHAKIIAALKEHADDQTASADTARARKDADTRSGKSEGVDDIEKRKKFYRSLNKLNRAALCLSGGGIRSATFCLGVIQALALYSQNPAPISEEGDENKKDENKKDKNEKDEKKKDDPPAVLATNANDSLLARFHYLSTVSGGGYIGSWLSAWRSRSDFPTVWQNLTSRPEGPDVEPPEISWLRSYSSYLTPKSGLLSADTWTGAAIFLRNLLLNWLVIIPAVAFVLLLLKLAVAVAVEIARADSWIPHLFSAVLGVALLIAVQGFITRNRPTRRDPPGTPPESRSAGVTQGTFIFGSVIWSLFSALFVTSTLTSEVAVTSTAAWTTYKAVFIGAGIGVVIFAAGWLAGAPARFKGKDFLYWALSGLVYGGLVGLGAHLYALMHPYDGNSSVWRILLPVIFGVPWVLVSQLFAEMVFVGLVSYEPNSDADREWLGRGAGWIAATAVIWGATTFVVFECGDLLMEAGPLLKTYIASVGGAAGVITALLGKSSMTGGSKKDEGKEQGWGEVFSQIGLSIAGPVFAAILAALLSVALDLLLLEDSLMTGLSKKLWGLSYIILWLGIGIAASFVVAAIASKAVNINRFSLHALYRNRLVRAYLGASRQRRTPDLFTGFDTEDNPQAYQIWPPKTEPDGKTNTHRLFHVVNIALNVVKSKRLAWQERKAESFTVSALHSGAAYKGFRPSIEYGGGHKKSNCGISLGTAMAISGAAASPNMGYHSSTSITLLLALFNVRLGWWLGNPGPEGNATYKDEGPVTAIRPLVEETFGLTTDDKPYVYLSDGGHFENLALYEMVRRRCRFIVAVDAGCDPTFTFEDLGNAVRKIYIDLGIRVRFDDLQTLRNRPKDEKTTDQGQSIPYYTIGTIDYLDADGAEQGTGNGYILYVKPAYHGTEGAGIRAYAAGHPTFPHESTGDQFFTESQFESYRSLGLDIMSKILSGKEQSGGIKFDRKLLGDIFGKPAAAK